MLDGQEGVWQFQFKNLGELGVLIIGCFLVLKDLYQFSKRMKYNLWVCSMTFADDPVVRGKCLVTRRFRQFFNHSLNLGLARLRLINCFNSSYLGNVFK